MQPSAIAEQESAVRVSRHAEGPVESAGDGAVERPAILHHQLHQPGMPRDVLRRPRLDQHFDRLFGRSRVLAVSAAAGTGKSVQAQLYAEASGLPTAWITLDPGHGSGRRLIPWLAQALHGQFRADAEVALRTSFTLEGTVEEEAALLARSLDPHPALLVIDECEHLELAGDALSALNVFLQYAPDSLRVMLLSRVDFAGPLQRAVLDGRIHFVDESVLRLTREENEELARRLGAAPELAAQVFDATGGWIAGATFGFRYGLREQGKANDLPYMIMGEVLDSLPADERQFLLDSSVAQTLTREAAAALCGDRAHRLWEAVRARHLPATTTTATTLVYHSLFRSFLHQRLLMSDPERHAVLVRTYAAHLAGCGHVEDTTELYLSIGDLASARTSAEAATPELCRRADWNTFMRWAEQLGEERLSSSPVLTAGLIRSLFGQRRFKETLNMVRTLDRAGRLRAAMEADPSLLATAAWALQANPAEAMRFLDRYEGDYRADVVRFMLQVCTDVSPAVPPLGSDWEDVERIISWGLLLQGRLADLAKFIPSDPGTPVTNPNVILAVGMSRDIPRARALWARVPQEIGDRPQSHFVEAVLLLFEGEPELALSAMENALSDCRKTNFPLASSYEVAYGYILLQLGRLEEALDVLREGIAQNAETGQLALVEWAQAFLGFGLLLTGDAAGARPVLSECVRSMRRSHRRLFLPLAAACLAEAEFRCGNEDAAHEAAETAYHTAAMMGNYFGLLNVLREFPDLAVRQDRHDPVAARWRRLVVSPTASPQRQPARATGTARLTLQPFGPRRDIWVEGVPQKIGRMKVIELMAFLVLHPDGVDRARLQTALFPDASVRNGGNHFRQISFKFRQITGQSLNRNDDRVGLPEETVVESADIQLEALVDAASHVAGAERAARLRDALDLVEGPYLAGSELPWAEERRHHLDLVEEEARLELIQLLIELGEPVEARQQCEAQLAVNRYSDPAYRLLVQVERMIGSESSVLAAYRRAVNALEELGLEPGDAKRLLDGNLSASRGAGRQLSMR